MHRQIYERCDLSGKILAGAIVAISLLFGVAVYYFQIYHYYTAFPVEETRSLILADADTQEAAQVNVSNFRAIDAESSPIRYRACFETDVDLAAFTDKFMEYTPEQAEFGPRNAPGWFDCFDAAKIGSLIEAGDAKVFLSRRNIQFGIDRVVAVTTSGDGYIWHELNSCGKKAYDGTPLGKDCPERR